MNARKCRKRCLRHRRKSKRDGVSVAVVVKLRSGNGAASKVVNINKGFSFSVIVDHNSEKSLALPMFCPCSALYLSLAKCVQELELFLSVFVCVCAFIVLRYGNLQVL